MYAPVQAPAAEPTYGMTALLTTGSRPWQGEGPNRIGYPTDLGVFAKYSRTRGGR